ncbi:MAG: hypothetical protein AVDCRST_MAG13-133, partial [uncultured Solirubrobacteraceae bacterium]
ERRAQALLPRRPGVQRLRRADHRRPRRHPGPVPLRPRPAAVPGGGRGRGGRGRHGDPGDQARRPGGGGCGTDGGRPRRAAV